MAIKYWLADVPTPWDTGAAWTGGAKPAAGDTAIMDGRHVGNVLAPAAAETVTDWYVTPAFTGLVFTSGAKGTINCTGRLSYKGSGASAWIITDCPKIHVETQNYVANAVNIEPDQLGGEFVVCTAGVCNIGGANALDGLYLGRAANGQEPVVSVSSGFTIGGQVVVDAGDLAMGGHDMAGLLTTRGGRVRITDPLAGTPLQFNILGGSVALLGETDIDIDSAYVMGGVLRASELEGKLSLDTLLVVGSQGDAQLDNGQPLGITAGWVGIVMPGGRFRAFAEPTGLERF